MPVRLRTVVPVGLFVALAIIFGSWIYGTAIQRAAHGEFPMGDSGMLLLLIVWWWPPELVLFPRDTPFDRAEMLTADLASEKAGIPNQWIFWMMLSALGWILLERLADVAAGTAFLDPTEQHLVSYGLRSMAFVGFLLLWIALFPIFRPPEAVGHSGLSRLSRIRYPLGLTALVVAVIVCAGSMWKVHLLLHSPEMSGTQKFHTVQGYLVWVLLTLYAALTLRRFVFPGTLSMR